MRYLIGVTLFLGSLFLIQLTAPELGSGIKRSISDLNYKKSLEYEALTLLSKDEVEQLLPLEKSVWWWLLNPKMVIAGVSHNPLVESVSVAPCTDLLLDRWGCFHLKVVERTPAFIASMADEHWLVGGDGTFITPLPSSVSLVESLSELQLRYGRLRVIRGLSSLRNSPDLVLSRFELAKSAMDQIEKNSGIEIEWGDIKGDNEILIKFKPYSFEAIFGLSGSDIQQVSTQSTRLTELLTQFKGREDRISRIDLALDKMAVVKLS